MYTIAHNRLSHAGVHNTDPAENVSILAHNCLSCLNDDQAYLITAGFLHKHTYESKILLLYQ